jgi:ABC-2 type transport system permease protein
MSLVPLRAMIVKDLKLFFSDRRSVIVSFVVPILIASFFGSIFGGQRTGEPARIAVALVDEDGSVISKAIVAGAAADKNLKLTTPSVPEARDAVRRGTTSVAVVIPKGFGDAAGRAFFGDGEKPELRFLYDPSHTMELAMIRGLLTQHVMEAVSKEMFGGAQGRLQIEKTLPQLESSGVPDAQKRALVQMLKSIQGYYNLPSPAAGAAPVARQQGITMPYAVREEAITAGSNVAYNGYAHSFAGMAVQFLLFAMANLGVEILLERQRGLWKRLRSAPVSKLTLLAGKAASGTLISLMILGVSFAFAIAVFGVRIQGSVLGFLLVSLTCSMMAASFGVLVAALGNTPATARGMTTLAVLMMVMLGGAWVPAFVFPAWLQQATLVVPVRWAIDGMDAMTWRGFGLAAALAPSLVLFGFAALFSAVAALRFRWEEA